MESSAKTYNKNHSYGLDLYFRTNISNYFSGLQALRYYIKNTFLCRTWALQIYFVNFMRWQ